MIHAGKYILTLLNSEIKTGGREWGRKKSCKGEPKVKGMGGEEYKAQEGYE